jgi:hypothetical protein
MPRTSVREGLMRLHRWAREELAARARVAAPAVPEGATP